MEDDETTYASKSLTLPMSVIKLVSFYAKQNNMNFSEAVAKLSRQGYARVILEGLDKKLEEKSAAKH